MTMSSSSSGTTEFLGGGAPNPDFCDDVYTFIEDDVENICVKVVDDAKLTWEDARSYCVADGADLVEIYTDSVNSQINAMLTLGRHYWIGVRLGKSDTFQYVSGNNEPSFEPWAKREPNNYRGKEECVEMIATKTGVWNDKRCSKKRNFICAMRDGY